MNKQELVRKYQEFLLKFSLSPEEAILGAGAACMMYGLRETINDIDMEIPESLFNHIAAGSPPAWQNLEVIYEVKETTGIRRARVIPDYMDGFDLHVRDDSHQTTMVEGVCVYTLEQLLRQKELMNREKDQADIFAIKKLLSEQEKKQ